MYVILVYDIDKKRVAKMLRLCRKYLNWIQNSVFEGEISTSLLKQLEAETKEIIDLDTDSVILFKSRDERWLEKQILGYERNELTNII